MVVEHEGRCLFFDCGLSGREHLNRLRASGFESALPLGIFVSHEHSDHSKCAGIIGRKWGIPVFSTSGTFTGAGLNRQNLPAGSELFRNGDTVGIGPFRVTTFRVSHDAADPSGFVVEAGGIRLGVATDMGEAGPLALRMLSGCHGLVLEFNHDLEMLWDGPYPWPLKQRVSSGLGHLSNEDASVLLEGLAHPGLGTCVLAHLSQENNTPELALESARSVSEDRFALIVGSRNRALPMIQIG